MATDTDRARPVDSAPGPGGPPDTYSRTAPLDPTPAAATPAASRARVLVVLGSIPLYGKERGNIQVFHALQSEPSVDALFLTHRDHGHEMIQPALDRLGLRWTVGTFPGFWSPRMGFRAWARRIGEAVRANRDLVRAAREHRATHVHVPAERMMLNLLPALWWLGVPVVFRLGDLPRQHRSLFRLIWRWFLIPTTTEFVCISEFVRSRLLEAGAPYEKTRVIRNVPPARGRSEIAFHERPRPDSGPALTVSYIGQITEKKGVDRLVAVALRLCREREDVRFLLAGDYSWKNPFAEELIRAVAAADLTDRIRFLGYVDDVYGLLSATDVLCVPSVWEEPLGNVVQEAKLAGVPSVVFPSGGLPELVVEDGVDGVVCSDNSVEALYVGVTHYLDMTPQVRKRMGAAARSSLETLGLTPHAFRSSWLRVYHGTEPAA